METLRSASKTVTKKCHVPLVYIACVLAELQLAIRMPALESSSPDFTGDSATAFDAHVDSLLTVHEKLDVHAWAAFLGDGVLMLAEEVRNAHRYCRALCGG